MSTESSTAPAAPIEVDAAPAAAESSTVDVPTVEGKTEVEVVELLDKAAKQSEFT